MPDRGWEHDNERVGDEEGSRRVQMGDDGVLDNGELQCLSRVPAQFAEQEACGDAARKVDPAQAGTQRTWPEVRETVRVAARTLA